MSEPRPIRIVETAFVLMPDGVRLAAKLWLPEDAEASPVPAILEYLPYRRRDALRVRDHAQYAWLAARGYACVRLDIRGSGDSEGVLLDEYTDREQEDGVAAIAWIAAQPWCDGKVGMQGMSWSGFNALQIAARRPPALKAVIAMGASDDRFASDVHRVGGCLSKDEIDWSATMFAWNALPPDPAVVGERWRAMWLERLEANRPWVLTWLSHQRRDAYWRHGSICEDFSAVAIPVYAVSGWADNYAQSVPRLVAGLPGRCKGLVGPWSHNFPQNGRPGPSIGWLEEARRWWDHWLKGRDTGLMDEPAYRVWMENWQPPAVHYIEKPGRWVAEAAWPSPRIDWRTLPLRADRTLGGEPGPAERLAICSPQTVGAAAGEVGRYGTGAEWPTDQREDDAGSLVFLSDPLPERTEILGGPVLTLVAASDRPQALVAVRLNGVASDGSSTRLSLGLLNLSQRYDREHAAPLVPGQRYQIRVPLDDIAVVLPAGHRLAVAISTTYWPIAWPSPQAVTLTVVAGETALALPVRPPDPADTDLRPFAEPDPGPQLPHEWTPPEAPPRRTIERDLLDGRTTVTFAREGGTTHWPDIATAIASDGAARYSIVDGDPLSARAWTDWTIRYDHAAGTMTAESRTEMTATVEAFRITARLRVVENGTEIFAREWDEAIPRDTL